MIPTKNVAKRYGGITKSNKLTEGRKPLRNEIKGLLTIQNKNVVVTMNFAVLLNQPCFT